MTEEPAPPVRPTVAAIQEEVARYYMLPTIEMRSQRRAIRIARPRQVAMYLCRELTEHSLPNIGRLFGGRDHSTVMHAIRRVEDIAIRDALFERDLGHLKERLA